MNPATTMVSCAGFVFGGRCACGTPRGLLLAVETAQGPCGACGHPAVPRTVAVVVDGDDAGRVQRGGGAMAARHDLDVCPQCALETRGPAVRVESLYHTAAVYVWRRLRSVRWGLWLVVVTAPPPRTRVG